MPKNGLILDQVSSVMKEALDTETKHNADVPLFDLKLKQIEELNMQSQDHCFSDEYVSETPTESRSLYNVNGFHKDDKPQMTGDTQSRSVAEIDLIGILAQEKQQTHSKHHSVLPGVEMTASNATFKEASEHLNQSPIESYSLDMSKNRNLASETTSTKKREYSSDISPSVTQNSMSQDSSTINGQISQMKTSSKSLEQTTLIDTETHGTICHEKDTKTIEEKILQSDSLLSLSERSTDVFPSPMVHEPNSDQSISTMTPTDSVLSPLTSSSLDCLTPENSWVGGESSGWRALGSEMPHRDSAYFSDSDLDGGEGLGRRSTDGLGSSRPGGVRVGGILMGIEEKMEIEDDGAQEHEDFEKEGKMKQVIHEFWVSNKSDNVGTDEIRNLESNMVEKGLKNAVNTIVSGDSQNEGNAEYIARLFSNGKDEPIKVFSFSDSSLNFPNSSPVKNNELVMSQTCSKETTFHDSGCTDIGLLSHSVSKSQKKEEIIEHCAYLQTANHKEAGCTSPEFPNSGSDHEQPSDKSKSRLSRFYSLQSVYSKCISSTDINTDLSNDDTKCTLTNFVWSETKAEQPSGEVRNTLDKQDSDANELGLRNLSCLEENEDEQTKERSESQLAVGELCFTVKEASQNSADEQVSCVETSKVESSDEFSRGASMGLELKEKELWSALEEDYGTEETVSGEINCHRFQQGELHLWPVENDQWAAAETRTQEAGLGSELFPSFEKKAWAEEEHLVVSHEFWESEANDELADSESHPSAQRICEDTFNDESLGQVGSEKYELILSGGIKETCISQQTPVEGLDFQQDENMENPDMENREPELYTSNIKIQVENLENPEQEAPVHHRPAEMMIHDTENSEAYLQNDVGDEFYGDEDDKEFCRLEDSKNMVGVRGCMTHSPSLSTTNHAQTVEFESLQYQKESLSSHSNNLPRDQIEAEWAPKTEASKVLAGGLEECKSCTVDMSNSTSAINLDDSSHLMSVYPELHNTETSRQDAESINCPAMNRKGQAEVFLEKERSNSPSFPSVTISTDPEPCKIHSSNVQCSAPSLISMELSECVASPHTEVDKCQNLSSFPNTVHHIEIKTSKNLSCGTDQASIKGCEVDDSSTSGCFDDANFLNQYLEERAASTITHNKGITANLGQKTHTSIIKENLIHPESNNVRVDDRNSLSQKAAHPPLSQCHLNSIPELLISEWKDLDEEPLEDFEKLEQLCCISGDEDTLGDLFLGNLDLLESLKKYPEQRTSGASGIKSQDESAVSEGNTRAELKEEVDRILKSSTAVLQNSEQCENISPNFPGEAELSLENRTGQHGPTAVSPCHSTDGSKGQRSLSKMQTKNGLMMQVCKEKLQYSLSENVKTNVLWGSTVSDSVIIHPWGATTTSSPEGSVSNKEEKESEEETPPMSPSVSVSEPAETQTEALTVLEQPEVTPSLSAANQAMKAKLARLSLSLPPLSLSLPLSLNPKGGFWEGREHRGGRRRGASTGSDPDEDEEEEQEDESPRRVIVVTETDVDKRVGLRSLLKSPKEPVDKDNRDCGRNVSFFDDVTVYLFDQETPTNELSSGSVSSSPHGKPPDTDGFGVGSHRAAKSKEHAVKPRSPTGVTSGSSSRFTVSPADDPHLV
ncbi:uncharacterized protein lmtk3 [Xyrauchen texanus]|uniref:uncharacterized protein lmtk3 n=1 Tax=Xyrauchen texanus TaxID=154827 RepID=UPI002241F8AD|nr:uncharacterized protein lmtk3 [Xyrauchen texanus]